MKLNIKKTSILFISLMIILNIVFSLFYISVHANHECHDEHCDICCTITSCKDIIHSLINKPQENTILAHIVLKSLVFIILPTILILVEPTLVNLKIKITN